MMIMTEEIKIYDTNDDYLRDKPIMKNRGFGELHIDRIADNKTRVTWVTNDERKQAQVRRLNQTDFINELAKERRVELI